MTVRKVEESDLPIIEGWAKARGCEFHHPLLSPYGFLAECEGGPLLVIWGYMILDIPVIQLDHLFSAPGTPMPQIREAWEAISRAVITWVKEINSASGTNYCLIRSFLNERVAQEAEKAGWIIGQQSSKTACYVV